MTDPKTKKDPTEEQDPKPQPPADPAGDPPAADPAPDPAADPAKDPADPKDPPAADLETDPADPEDPPAADPETDPQPESEEVAALKLQLVEANARLAAYKSGIKPTAVDDAVVLAMHAVRTAGGELSEEAIHQAITTVLERHPEWNTATIPVAPVKAGAEPSADPSKTKTNAVMHGKVVL